MEGSRVTYKELRDVTYLFITTTQRFAEQMMSEPLATEAQLGALVNRCKEYGITPTTEMALFTVSQASQWLDDHPRRGKPW